MPRKTYDIEVKKAAHNLYWSWFDDYHTSEPNEKWENYTPWLTARLRKNLEETIKTTMDKVARELMVYILLHWIRPLDACEIIDDLNLDIDNIVIKL